MNRSSDAFTMPKQLPTICRERPDATAEIKFSTFLRSVTWNRARKFAEKETYPMTAGSDSHIPQTIGRAYTEVECRSKDTGSVLATLRAGSVSPVGRPVRATERLRKLFYGKREES